MRTLLSLRVNGSAPLGEFLGGRPLARLRAVAPHNAFRRRKDSANPSRKASLVGLLRRDLHRPKAKLGIDLAGFLPTQHVERFDELADAVDLSAEQAKLDNLFIAEVLGEIGIDLVFVDGALALLEQIRIMQRCLLTLAEALAAHIIEQVIDHVLATVERTVEQ